MNLWENPPVIDFCVNNATLTAKKEGAPNGG